MPSRAARRLRRVVRRLVPFIFLCYVVAYIDRVNIGFAATELQRDLGLSDAAYGLGGGLFFLGYCLFEIPSNLIMERVGARIWIARIMIGWGLVSMAMMFVVGQWSFYAMRVLLGIAEAGFFPGMVLYLTYWVPAAERAKTGALFMTAAPVAVLIGDIFEIQDAACPCGRTSWRARCVGRVDDMFIVRGVNVYPSAIQAIVADFRPEVTGRIRVVLPDDGRERGAAGPGRGRGRRGHVSCAGSRAAHRRCDPIEAGVPVRRSIRRRAESSATRPTRPAVRRCGGRRSHGAT